MALPPFNPNEALPEDDDVASGYPAVERTFRDVVESWLVAEHGRSGHHAILTKTTSQKNAITDWEVGSLVYDTTLGKFQFLTAADADVWLSLGPEFPAGTRLPFQQTNVPAGWTAVSDAAYNDATFKSVTGAVATGGTAAFSDTFASRTPAGTIGGTALTTAQLPEHDHEDLGDNSASVGAVSGGGSPRAVLFSAGARTGTAGAGETHTHTFTGTAMDFAVKFVGLKIGVKD